jgi:hypothetical protein
MLVAKSSMSIPVAGVRECPECGLNTTRVLAHARRQADQRSLDGVLIVDEHSHHYENECYDEFLPFIENEVLRQLVLAGRAKRPRTVMPTHGRAHHALSAVRIQKDRGRQPYATSSSAIAGRMRELDYA